MFSRRRIIAGLFAAFTTGRGRLLAQGIAKMTDGFLATTCTDTGVPFACPISDASPDGNVHKNLFLGDGGKFLTHAAGLDGYYNTGVGFFCLVDITTGKYNTAFGFEALNYLTTGAYNTAIGEATLIYKLACVGNTSLGWKANIGISFGAGGTGTGDYNTCVGYAAGLNLDRGNANTAVGKQAMGGPTPTGSNNTAVGNAAGCDLTSGHDNTFIGTGAGDGVTTGSGNVVVGNYSLAPNAQNTVIIGDGAGHPRVVADSNSVRMFNSTTSSEVLDLAEDGTATLYGPARLKSYSVSALPVPGVAGGMIFVSDESGGCVPAFSDGSHWRRITDRAIVS